MSMLLTAQAMKLKVGNPTRKLVLLKLADNANDKGECFPSYQHIADHCEVSRRSVISHIDVLIKMGLVEKKLRKNQDGSSSNLYILHLEKGSENISPPSENGSLPPSENISPITNHSINQSINQNNIVRTVQKFEVHFEQFWQAGMTKVNKQKSLKSFKSAYESYHTEYPTTLEDFTQMLIDDVRKRLALHQFGFDKLHPTTYLNNWRWLDEYPSIATSPQNSTAHSAGQPLRMNDPGCMAGQIVNIEGEVWEL
ncbi:helix-turn-helix domain-containing protein [Haemophilus parahaemolyticus]|uniref:helix-turn-helix domain-containing protein n=1 Tax=Haemophilus parahaemolyticus TaxID=735 RepID=UPI00288992E8|nr:helix-turn-helix domain-containing protein [Haemophilus parahaemolyticus]